MIVPSEGVIVIRGVVLDVDGTVVRGRDPIPGAPAAVGRLREGGFDVCFCSNNPTKGPAAYVDRLGAAGIDADETEVVTAADSTVAYLRTHHRDDALYVLGEYGFVEQLEAAGLTVVDDHDDAEAGVISVDREFDYDDLSRALWALEDGTPYVGSDPDRVIPESDGFVPGSGAVINAVRGVLDHDPEAVLGKPSAAARELVLDITEQDELLENNPTLRRSIRLRNPYVDPLNFIQLHLLKEMRQRDDLATEDPIIEAFTISVNGIAAGLKNTG